MTAEPEEVTALLAKMDDLFADEVGRIVSKGLRTSANLLAACREVLDAAGASDVDRNRAAFIALREAVDAHAKLFDDGEAAVERLRDLP